MTISSDKQIVQQKSIDRDCSKCQGIIIFFRVLKDMKFIGATSRRNVTIL